MCVFVNSLKEEFDLGRLLILLLMGGLCQQCERGTRSRSILVFTVFVNSLKEEFDAAQENSRQLYESANESLLHLKRGLHTLEDRLVKEGNEVQG